MCFEFVLYIAKKALIPPVQSLRRTKASVMSSDRMIELLHGLRTTFFDKENLEDNISLVCNLSPLDVRDPITATVSLFLHGQLGISLCKVGLHPFFDAQQTVIPYSSMSGVQRQFLSEAVVCHRDLWVISNGRILFKQPANKARVVLSSEEVLTAMCRKVFQSEQHPSVRAKTGICNILLQRVGSNVSLSADVRKRLNERMQTEFGLHDKNE